jgi:hypothetical protein
MLHNLNISLNNVQLEQSRTLCFPIRICTVTADATNGCGENIGLAKLFLALIQARETPRVLVRVIVSKELVVRDKIPPSPVLVSRHASGRARTE